MAAVSRWPSAAHPGPPYSSNSSSGAAQVHEIRTFDIPAAHADDENSDAYSFEAHSEGSGAGNAAADSSDSDAVRPDSLALTSPLEQLTRSLSFNKKEGPHTTISDTKSALNTRMRPPQDAYAGMPPVEQVMLEYLAAQPAHEVNASTYIQPASKVCSEKDLSSDSVSSKVHPAQAGESSQSTTFEPVRFSDDTARTGGGVEDISDGQSQLISAFRSSYHTYMTRSGGMRDSSYSWIGPDAESPNATLDFKQAEASQTKDLVDLGRYEDHDEEEAPGADQDDVADLWDAEGKSKARVSSWDSQGAKKMGLHRIPSQKTSGKFADGRTSDMSALEPFPYSSYESALQASREAKDKVQMRASNWTSLTDTTAPEGDSTAVGPPSTMHEGDRSSSMYAYAVDSPSVLQGYFAGPSRVASAAPRPPRSQAGRTNFSRPHDTLNSEPLAESQDSRNVEQLTHPNDSQHDVSHLPYAASNQGYPHPSRQPYDSVYSAYTQTSDFDTPRGTPFQGATGNTRPGFSPSSSSHTAYTIQDANTSMRPDLQTVGSYTRSKPEQSPGPANVTSMHEKRHKRTQSQVLASAIAKHRNQRAAAGLTTEGQYYVDPKSQKYYFVADSGQAGGSALAKSKGKGGEENEKPKERRKLYKKEHGWEVTRINQSKVSNVASPPRTPQVDQRDRSLSLSGRSGGSSRASEEGHGSGSKWKLWPSGRSHGSRENLPPASPSQLHNLNEDPSRRQANGPEDQDSLELIAEVRALTGSSKISSSPSTRHQGSMRGHPSPQIASIPMNHPSRSSPSPSQASQDRSHDGSFGYNSQGASSRQGHGGFGRLQPPLPYHGQPGHRQRPAGMERSDSVYSNYSYYEMPSDQGYISSTRASPVMDRSLSGNRSQESFKLPMHSPYLAPTAPQFQPSGTSHSRQPSSTLDKAKYSMSRTTSMQLSAPAKHQNLTVPKGGFGDQQDLAELARMNPNDPLVCLHLGIDAHERGNLEDSAALFEKSANGGCGLGMLMYGLSLRHGWGCDSDPERGFRYLQQAAESVVENLDRVISGHVQLSEQQMEEQSAKSELVLSIYELGQCFLRGWGVAKDKKTALQYFTLAANLGDPDAQSELGFCYSTGRGCKKDLKKAARYYRMAAKQGQTTYGMQWIFKSKYDD